VKQEIVMPVVPEGTVPGELDLTTVDGNAFSIMGAVRRSLKEAGNTAEVLESYRDQATAGDYDHLLRVSIAFTESA
jgi:hypothetical protein